MKAHIASAFLIVFICWTSQTDARLSISQRKRLVKEMNYFRQQYAIGLQIGNMHELSYDNDLEKVGEKFLNCEDVKNGSNYRVYLVYEIEKLIRSLEAPSERPDAEFIAKSALSYWNGSSRIHEGLHPLQFKIACVNLVKACPDPHSRAPEPDPEAICLYGPKNTDPRSEWKHGKPGSLCAHGKAKSGLCKGSPTSRI